MSETVIGEHPPNDGREWDCQCARCGSSMDWVDCNECGGDGYHVNEDLDAYDDTDDTVSCDMCSGRGGWSSCLSSPEWCEANPLPERENVKRGAIEWFVIPEGVRP